MPAWSGTLTGPDQLAAVIQGEAATPAGQFAVASTMYNRMTGASGFSGPGGGSYDVSQVVTPSQYNGYSSTPGSYAQQLAGELWAGQSPSGGSTGNAVYYAAANSSSAPAGGTNIGGNVFSDSWGSPSGNYVAPSYGGLLAEGPADTSSGLAAGSYGSTGFLDSLALGGSLSPFAPLASVFAGDTPAGKGMAGVAPVATAAGSQGFWSDWLLRAGVFIAGAVLVGIGLTKLMDPDLSSLKKLIPVAA